MTYCHQQTDGLRQVHVYDFNFFSLLMNCILIKHTVSKKVNCIMFFRASKLVYLLYLEKFLKLSKYCCYCKNKFGKFGVCSRTDDVSGVK